VPQEVINLPKVLMLLYFFGPRSQRQEIVNLRRPALFPVWHYSKKPGMNTPSNTFVQAWHANW